jgi:hypothetical protein
VAGSKLGHVDLLKGARSLPLSAFEFAVGNWAGYVHAEFVTAARLRERAAALAFHAKVVPEEDDFRAARPERIRWAACGIGDGPGPGRTCSRAPRSVLREAFLIVAGPAETGSENRDGAR